MVLLAPLLLCGAVIAQEIDVTGSWSGFSVAGGGTYQNEFALAQKGTTVTGSGIANGVSGTIAGTINGNQLQYHSIYPFPGLLYNL